MTICKNTASASLWNMNTASTVLNMPCQIINDRSNNNSYLYLDSTELKDPAPKTRHATATCPMLVTSPILQS